MNNFTKDIITAVTLWGILFYIIASYIAGTFDYTKTDSILKAFVVLGWFIISLVHVAAKYEADKEKRENNKNNQSNQENNSNPQ